MHVPRNFYSKVTFNCIYILKESQGKVWANQSAKLEVGGDTFHKLNYYTLQNFVQTHK